MTLPKLTFALFLLTFIVSGRADVTEAWVRRYSNITSNSNDHVSKIVTDFSGNVIVTGLTIYDGLYGQLLTIKYSGVDASIIWLKHHPVSSFQLPLDTAVTPEGDVIVGATHYDGTNLSYFITKYSGNNGSVLWTNREEGTNFYYFAALAIDNNGNIAATGKTDDGQWYSVPDYFTKKYSGNDGAVIWSKQYIGTNEFDYVDAAKAVAIDPSGNVFVTGISGGDYFTIKYDSDSGEIIWNKRDNPFEFGNSTPVAIAVDRNGNVVVTGSADNGLNGLEDPFHDFYTVKYASTNGSRLWAKLYTAPFERNDQATALALDSNGNAIVTGLSESGRSVFGSTLHDFITIKYSEADGEILWERRFDSVFENDDYPTALVVDASNNVVVTGSSLPSPSWHAPVYEFYTAKYASSNGAVMWETQIPSLVSQNPTAMALDHQGNVFVGGLLHTTPYTTDYLTIKYAATNGEVAWATIYDGLTERNDRGYAVAIDSNGDVIVTGSSETSLGDSDFYTAKYNGSDGRLVWEIRYNGPGYGDDGPAALALDAAGNVILTGYITSIRGDANMYTVKYSGLDGSLLWERTFASAPYNGSDYGVDVGIDLSGNVIITGHTSAGPPSHDYNIYTAKYSGATGAIL